MRKISILGSTGSVGSQALDVIRNLEDVQVVSLSAGKNISLLEEQIREFNPKFVCVQDQNDSLILSKKFKNIEFFHGIDGICSVSKLKDCDLVLNAISGFVGIYASISSAKEGKTLLLANKESVVCGSKFLMDLAKKNNCKIKRR